MESAGKALFFATSLTLLSRCRFGFPDLTCHAIVIVPSMQHATSEETFLQTMRPTSPPSTRARGIKGHR
jgi:hypothetical protein